MRYSYLWSVPDLPLCLCVLKHRAPLAREGGGASSCHFFLYIYDGFLLICGAILNLKSFCLGAIPDIGVCLTVCVGLPGLPPSGAS